MGDWDGNALQKTRKVAVLIVGSAVILVGVVFLPLPGPGSVVIVAGLAILAQEFSWAKRWLATARQYVVTAVEKARLKLKRKGERN